MFGYVLPMKSEMKIRDFETYRASYCGVCKQLQKSYGVFSRFLLNYDLVLLAVVTDALTGEEGETCSEGCFVNPLAKRRTLHSTGGLSLAADGLVMLSYHKLQDNLLDESFGKRFFYRLAHPLFAHMYKKAAKRHPELSTVLETEMARQAHLEAAGCTNLDEAAEPTAKMCAALFAAAARSPEEKTILHRLGLFCGQIVYLLDAAEDYSDDLAKNRYNVLLTSGYTKEEAIEVTKRRCRMAAGEIALCYNLLELRQYKDILDNIFFLGLVAGINTAGIKRGKRRLEDGSDQSI